MAKEINLEKIISIFEKSDIPEMLDKYNKLGQWIHSRVQHEREELSKKNEELKSIQEKLINNK